MTLVLNFLQIFACKLSSLGPGAELLPQATEIRPRAACGPPQGRVGLRSVCGLPFQHAPFPRSRSGFCSILFFSRRIPSWIPPFPSLVGRFLVTFWLVCAQCWLKLGCYFFVMFFGSVFFTIFVVFLTSLGGQFCMFFAYLFELFFCLLFPLMFFKFLHTFKTRDLQNTLFFSSKNVILEEPPLHKKFENLNFLGLDRALFFA